MKYNVGDMLPTIYGNSNKILSVEFYPNSDIIRGYWVEFYQWSVARFNYTVFIKPDEIRDYPINSK